jgi:hypothetical protein
MTATCFRVLIVFAVLAAGGAAAQAEDSSPWGGPIKPPGPTRGLSVGAGDSATQGPGPNCKTPNFSMAFCKTPAEQTGNIAIRCRCAYGGRDLNLSVRDRIIMLGP